MTNLGIKKSDTAPFYGAEEMYLNSTMQNTTTVATAADNRVSLSKHTINNKNLFLSIMIHFSEKSDLGVRWHPAAPDK